MDTAIIVYENEIDQKIGIGLCRISYSSGDKTCETTTDARECRVTQSHTLQCGTVLEFNQQYPSNFKRVKDEGIQFDNSGSIYILMSFDSLDSNS